MGLNIGKDINIGLGLKMILDHFKALEQSRDYHVVVPTRTCVNLTFLGILVHNMTGNETTTN